MQTRYIQSESGNQHLPNNKQENHKSAITAITEGNGQCRPCQGQVENINCPTVACLGGPGGSVVGSVPYVAGSNTALVVT